MQIWFNYYGLSAFFFVSFSKYFLCFRYKPSHDYWNNYTTRRSFLWVLVNSAAPLSTGLTSPLVIDDKVCRVLRPCSFTCVSFFLFLEPLLVLIEYVPYGDLLGYLRKSRGLNDTYYKDPDITPQTSLTSQQLIKFAWQIADGMSYLSSRSVSSGILIWNVTFALNLILLCPWIESNGLE